MKRIVSIKIYNLMLWILFFALYEPLLLVDKRILTITKGSSLVIILLFLFFHLRARKLINAVVPFCLIIVCSGVYNWIIGTQGYLSILYGSIIYAVGIYELYTLTSYYYYYNHIEELFECMYKIIRFYCIGSIISMIVLGHSSRGTEITYLWGNKFITSYLFMIFAALFLNKYWDKIRKYYRYKVIYFCLIVVLITINAWLCCSTTMIASFAFLIVLFIPDKAQSLLTNPKTIIIAIFSSALFIFAVDLVLSSSMVQQVVKQVLGKSLTLTGRVQIYDKLVGVISDSLLFGYGKGNRVIELIVGYGNAQNGLMQILVNYGLLGMIAFLYLVYHCVQYVQEGKNILPMYLVVYSLIISAFVEVSFNNLFFMMIFIIYWYGKKVRKIIDVTKQEKFV